MHSIKRGRYQAVFFSCALGASCAACGTQFDSISELEGLRVMGVQKSQPFAAPGEEVELRLLYHDTGLRGDDDAEGEPREIQRFWLAGCENPPTDLYAFCLQGFNQGLGSLDLDGSLEDLSPQQLAELLVAAQEQGLNFGTEDTFTLRIADDIISGRPTPTDPGQPPYGLNYVFFAACAGEMRFEPGGTLPIACYDAEGERASARDFVIGYTSIYSYEDIDNSNPTIQGISVKGKRLSEEQVCIGTACETLVSDPERRCSEGVPKVARCRDEEDLGSCDKFELQVEVDPASVDVDELLTRRQGSEVTEQMWVSYHTDRGKLNFDLALVHDVATGFNERPYTEYVAAEVPGPAHVWAVVRDNRGGTEWARFEVCVEDSAD